MSICLQNIDNQQTTTQRHPAISYINSFLSLIIPSYTSHFTNVMFRLKYSDHNLVGAALELLNEIMNTYGKIEYVWGTAIEFEIQSKGM